jgi:hypothetical protein
MYVAPLARSACLTNRSRRRPFRPPSGHITGAIVIGSCVIAAYCRVLWRLRELLAVAHIRLIMRCGAAAITLRNNLMTILPNLSPCFANIQRWQATLITVIPPYILAFFYRDVDVTAGITGGYPGVFIQLAIPATLALLARRWEAANMRLQGPNVHASPFRDIRWPYAILVWSALCLLTETVNLAAYGL